MTTAPPVPFESPDRAWQVAGLRSFHQSRLYRFGSLFAKNDEVLVGRTRQCHIRIRDDDAVSRRHGIIARVADHRYMLRAIHGKSMVVAPAGDYGMRREVTWVLLDIGMHIQLGNSILVPVDAHGEAPLTARRYSEYIRGNLQLYGSADGAHEHAGIPRRVLQKYDIRNAGDSRP